MGITIALDRIMADRQVTLADVAKNTNLSEKMLAKAQTGDVSAIRLSSLDALCEAFDCDPGDILVRF